MTLEQTLLTSFLLDLDLQELIQNNLTSTATSLRSKRQRSYQ